MNIHMTSTNSEGSHFLPLFILLNLQSPHELFTECFPSIHVFVELLNLRGFKEEENTILLTQKKYTINLILSSMFTSNNTIRLTTHVFTEFGKL